VDTLGLSFLAQNCEELLHVLVEKCGKKRSPLSASAAKHGYLLTVLQIALTYDYSLTTNTRARRASRHGPVLALCVKVTLCC
jgi:hypothetical protein